MPSSLFARAMTSLPAHYRDNLDALDAHLMEEHRSFVADAPDVPRAHLCCSEYRNGPAVKSALESAAARAIAKTGDVVGNGVRTALNHPEGYCAIAHVSSATAAAAASVVHEGARCSPLTHASKEPESLLSPSSFSLSAGKNGEVGNAFFGMSLGESVQDGPARGLVVTMSPGSLPVDEKINDNGWKRSGSQDDHRANSGTRGEGGSRKLTEFSSTSTFTKSTSVASQALEKRWRDSWSAARGRHGAEALAESVPWTSSKHNGGGGSGENGHGRGLWVSTARQMGSGAGDGGRAQRFHMGKVAGYRAALEHLGGKMEVVGETAEELGRAVSEACGWDNVSFVHSRADVLYLR